MCLGSYKLTNLLSTGQSVGFMYKLYFLSHRICLFSFVIRRDWSICFFGLYFSIVGQSVGSFVCKVFVLCLTPTLSSVLCFSVILLVMSNTLFSSSVSEASVFRQFFVTSSGPWLLQYSTKYFYNIFCFHRIHSVLFCPVLQHPPVTLIPGRWARRARHRVCASLFLLQLPWASPAPIPWP